MRVLKKVVTTTPPRDSATDAAGNKTTFPDKKQTLCGISGRRMEPTATMDSPVIPRLRARAGGEGRAPTVGELEEGERRLGFWTAGGVFFFFSEWWIGRVRVILMGWASM